MAKQKHKQKHAHRDDAAFPPTPPPSPPPLHLSLPPPPATMPPSHYPLLICSIGNPVPQYANTLHSAGHHLLHAVYSLATRNYEYTGFSPNRSWGNGAVSFPRSGGGLGWGGNVPARGYADGAGYTGKELQEELWTWWRSGSYMNVSGRGVGEAYRRWKLALRGAGFPAEMVEGARLVVLHDELEKGVGKFAVKRDKASVRGHNGLKSVAAALAGQDFVRIGVGIDRPAGRGPDEVARHVLRTMTNRELKGVEGVAPAVLEVLRDLGEGK